MRDIRFRFWNNRLKKMDYEPDYNGVSHKINDSFTEPLDAGVWLQYTGLKDKDGKEIWEGDVVKWGEYVIESVFYNELDACFETQTSLICSETMEVIGNIYETPELMEEENGTNTNS